MLIKKFPIAMVDAKINPMGFGIGVRKWQTAMNPARNARSINKVKMSPEAIITGSINDRIF